MACLSAAIITGDRIGSAQPFVRKWRPGHRWPFAAAGEDAGNDIASAANGTPSARIFAADSSACRLVK